MLDREAAQCKVDADCTRFDGTPTCQAGVCVDTGLGPDGCFFGEPTTQEEYLNACSRSRCVPFDDCDDLGMCEGTPRPGLLPPTNPTRPPLSGATPVPTVACDDGTATVIWMRGAADFSPLMRAAQRSLSAIGYRAVFQNATSCDGVSSQFDASRKMMRDPAATATSGWAFYFDDQGNQVNCKIRVNDDGAGVPIEIGVSDLYAPTCNSAFAPGTAVAEYTGPVVPFVLSVKANSSAQSISTEAARIVFGRGGQVPATGGFKALPWNNHNFFSIRNAGAASTVLTSLLIDVPRDQFWGVDQLSTDNLRDSLLTTPEPNSSIGILSVDYNDKNRGNLRALYLQSKGQRCGYLPDSSPTTTDKQNVRDGHYPLWGYVHFFTPIVDGGGPSERAQEMVLLLSVPKLEQQLLDDIIAASLVPQCAMEVARTSEIGDYVPQTGARCGCYFDFKTLDRNDCQVCDDAGDCPSARPACNYGFCEVE